MSRILFASFIPLSITGCGGSSTEVPLVNLEAEALISETTSDRSMTRENTSAEFVSSLNSNELEDPLLVIENESSLGREFEDVEEMIFMELEDPLAPHYEDNDQFIPIDI